MLNIVIIDKHPIFRKGISLIVKDFNSEITVAEYFSFKEFYKSRLEKVNIVILGLNSDEEFREISLGKNLKKHLAKSKLIICEASKKTDNIVEYLSLGMWGYLKKDNDVNEILECLATVLAGNKYIRDRYILSHFNGTLRKHPERVAKDALTKRQRQVADLLVKGRKTSEISDSLVIKTSTVSTIKMQIYKKLKVDNIIDLKSQVDNNTKELG
ncbi:response regulator transcription factor [Dyadobacter sp. CY312]|uniref:response regulator transcription factor n=1 Tax=Dyadobacter sp. CY312 TaxID=2907303 RepID=UPI001F434246|nr:response regulator transcription factor [Dyadobacter sp. CY312]MCE7044634.1 response regulator transcription factor [Dyadobacter sp. CY312]